MRGWRTLAAALALAAATSGGALAGGPLRAQVTTVNKAEGWLEILGNKIYATDEQLSKVIENGRYVVRWDEVDGRNVATSINPYEDGGS